MNEGRFEIAAKACRHDDEQPITKSEEDKRGAEEHLELEGTGGDDKTSYDNESYIATGFASTVEKPSDDDVLEKGYSENLVIKLAVESRVVMPTGWRITLRSIMMSLLVSNSVLWIFTCLEGTAYTLNMYQSQYYGEMSWNVITLICLPLFILYRMHSAGCLFEIWSYA